MKIIANVTSDRFLCEVSSEELARLHGMRGRYEDAYNKILMSVKVGYDFDITGIDDNARLLRTLDQNRMEKITNALRQALDSVENIREDVQALTLFEKLKEES